MKGLVAKMTRGSSAEYQRDVAELFLANSNITRLLAFGTALDNAAAK
jgi:hypothetical protein